MEQLVLKSNYDRNPIYCHYFGIENPIGIIQVIHGMKEHQERYEPFAAFLNEKGYAVITSDLRGHGKNATLLGYMEGKKPWEALVQDQVTIKNYLMENYPTTPIFLFAHSMGTIIARNLIQKNASNYEKIVLSGVPAYQFGAKFGIVMANIIGKFKSNSYVSPFLEHQTLGSFEKSVKNASSPVDWISISKHNIQNYLNDPYCNIPFTVSAYKALYHLVNGMHQKKSYYVTEPNKPILFLVGAEDPCPLGMKGLQKSIQTLVHAGYENVTYKRYENMRHEILNEDNNEIVYEDILSFYQNA